MKEYKLAAWLDLPGPFQRTVYRRMLSDMSHRYVTGQQLMASSGATKLELRSFLLMLEGRNLLLQRESDTPASLLGPLGGWIKRAIQGDDLVI